jgi:subtilisin-like proprotein convertase family protein
MRYLAVAVAALGGLILYASLAGAGSPAPDSSRHLLMVPDSAGSEAALTRSDARVVARYEEFTLVEARGEDDSALREAGASRRDDLREVGLPGTSGLDPLAERESLAAKGVAEPAEALVLVQFVGPIKDAWLERLRSTGARIVEYAAQDGYLLHARGAEVDRLAALVGTYPAVRAVTRVMAGDKVSDELASNGRQEVAVQTIAGADGADARRAAAAGGLRVRTPSQVGERQTQFLSLSRSEIEALAADPAVLAIVPSSKPKLMDESAAQIVAGNLGTTGTAPAGAGYLTWLASRGFGVGTLGFAIDVTDEGVDNGATTNPAHPDFYAGGSNANPSRVAYQHDYTPDTSAMDCGGHGTNVASIAAGYNNQPNSATDYNDGAGYNYGLGVAPLARIGSSKIFDCNGNLAVSFNPTAVADAAYAGGARISNNSWGFANNYGGYSPDSQEYDALVRDAQPGPAGTAGNQPMVEVFAAGNQGNRVGDGSPAGVESDDGYGSVIAPATAKNVITVGASEGVRSNGGLTPNCGVTDALANNAKDILDYSSRGPTDDMRQKPDLVAPGTHVTGASPQHAGYDGVETCPQQFPAGNVFYSLISGTSQAAPGVSGAAALFREWWLRTRPAEPSPALTKAVLLNTATDVAGGLNGKGSVTASAPNADEGWGRVNLGSAIAEGARVFLDQTVRLTTTGTSDRRAYQVSNAARPVRVTLAWTDAPGMVDANPALVNNLDLVVSAGGRRYLGNVISGGVSRVGGTPDTHNNVESVALPAGTSGRLSVEVRGTNIAGNGVPNNTGAADPTDQDFALVVSNASATSPAPQFSQYQTTIGDARPGGDADGALEPGEGATIGERLRNDGGAAANSISGTLTGSSALAVQRNTSAFAGVGAGGTTAGATPYAASLSASAACGADVGATLNITSSGGTQAVPLSLGTGAAGPVTSTSSTAVPRSIPDDNSNGVESALTVSGSGRIKDVDVVVGRINHPWVGDLALELRHPDGTTVELARHPGGPDNNGNNFISTVFDDEAAATIGQGGAPYTGRFRPQNDQLSRLDGKDKQGTWSLRVKDLFEANTGTLVSWGTSLRSAVCDWVTPAGPGSGHTTPEPAPSFAIAPAEQRLADALGGRLTVLGACAAACRATAKLSVSGKVARSLGLTKRRTSRPVSLGTGSARRRSAGRLSYRVRLTRRARSALRGEDRVTGRLSVAVNVTGEPDVKLKQSVGLRSTAGLGSVARKGLRLRAACSRTCRLAVGLWLDARTARKLGLKVKRGAKQLRVASRTATVSSRGRALSLKMARATRAAAARQKRLSATLKAVAGPSAGPTRAASQTLVLRR